MSKSPVILSAPSGAGKTRNAESLRAMFGCTCIVDGWDGVSEVPDGALVLTHLPLVAAPGVGDGQAAA